MQNDTEKVYRKLREKYTDEEIVDSVLFNEDLSAKEQREVDEEFRKIRLERLSSMTAKDKLIGDMMQMKILIKKYFRQELYDEQYSFANQLKRYSNRSNKEIAED